MANQSCSPLLSLPPDYFGTHRDALHSYGGYAPNMPPSSTTQAIRPPIGVSTTRRDYLPPCVATPAETTSQGNVFLGRSGFSVNKALHNPTANDVLKARRALASDFYSIKSNLNEQCLIPDQLQTETHERFNKDSLVYPRCGLVNEGHWMHAPGSRDSGFTNCYSTVNPVHWRQLDPTCDQLSRNDLRLNAASVSQTDYRPHDLVNYVDNPIQGVMKTRTTKGTGFTIAKELHPCFLPEPCVYGGHTTSYLGDPSRFDTTYFHDYKHKTLACSENGFPILGNGFPKKKLNSNTEQSPEFSLGCSAPRDFITETRESFINHWPLEGQRNFGLAFPISKVSSSGFVHSIKKHGLKSPRCYVDVEALDTSPQRYNPWPRFYLGHRTILEKGYRPNPITTGVDYSITNSLPTTGSVAETYLY